jgi:heavy metal sensor kinase
LLNRPDDEPHDRPYFAAWRAGGSSLASSDEGAPLRRPDLRGLTLGTPAIFRWQSPARREAILAGPRGTMILVGKPIDRELGELRAFAWQTVATGLMVLAVGLIGGWITSRSITRPIATISQTASAISASNLSRRIQTPDVDQELVGLATILNDMFARLEAAFLRQSRFTSDASHELRTPLAVIRSHAELALSKPRTADEYRETLAACLAAASRMAALVDGLLTLARADAGRLDADFKSVDLESVVEEVVDQYRPQAQSAAVSLSTSLDGPAVVRGDLAFLSRIAGNLLSNAIRYTPAGGSVRVSLVADGREARLAIEDTGCGMSPEDQRQVFDRFFRADKARSRALGGNGLGLAICRSLVEAHGGTITFHSVLDRGTRFEVRLPLAVARAVIESQPSLPSPELSGPVRDRTS